MSISGSEVSGDPLAALVEIPATDRPLDGLWFDAAEPAVGGVVLSHGNTMNFAVGAPRFLPPVLVPRGFACLSYNRRSHDILSTRDSRHPVGGAFQTAAADLDDTAAAVEFVRRRGHAAPVLVGHSNGGMLTAAYGAGRTDVAAMVLLSAHRGGRDIVPMSCAAGHLAGADLDRVIDHARSRVRAGAGSELMLLPGWWYVISAESFLDRLENTPDLLESAEQITCPVLFVVGDQEPPDVYPAHEFAARSPGACDVVVVEDCDHFYRGREAVVASIVSEWLDGQTLPGTDQGNVR